MERNSSVPEVSVVETDKIELTEPIIILGFAGPGLVGGIAVSHIIEQLGMKEIAHVRSRYMSPAVVFFDGKLRHPFRIYSDDGGKLCAIVCEIPLRNSGAYPIASALLDWAEEKGAKELIVLEGIPVDGIPIDRKTFCAAEANKIKEYEAKGVGMVSAGMIYGIAGSILNECLTRKISGVAFLTPAFSSLPDPEAAATIIETLNQVFELKVNTQELLNKADKLKQELNEVAQNRQRIARGETERDSPEDRLYA